MTTELDNADAARAEERGGLSRRQLIKASVVAGAAAWTAPAIIDSLASPAAASSGPCTVYWEKITGPTGIEDGTGHVFNQCYSSCPAHPELFPVADALWGGDCARPGGGCDAGAGDTHQVTLSGVGPYTLTLPTGCHFSDSTGWQIGGRYHELGTSDSLDSFLLIPATDGATSAQIPTNDPNTGKALGWVYVKFCSSIG